MAGSIHLLRGEDHPLPPVYEKAYQDANRVVFEIDLETTKSQEAQRHTVELGRLPDGESLDQWLSGETLADLRGYLKGRGLAGAQVERLRPGMIAMTITSMEAMRIGALPQFGVESVFDAKARADGKPVAAL
ncbi:MAG: TraB/GumN family protein, partial [Verrucomicrobiales bacterium]